MNQIEMVLEGKSIVLFEFHILLATCKSISDIKKTFHVMESLWLSGLCVDGDEVFCLKNKQQHANPFFDKLHEKILFSIHIKDGNDIFNMK